MLHKIIFKLVLSSLAVYLTSWATQVGVPHSPAREAIILSVVVAIVLGVINVTIKPIVSIISIPINLVTLGLFSFVINGGMVFLASKIVPGFVIPSLIIAIVFSFLLSIVNGAFHLIEGE